MSQTDTEFFVWCVELQKEEKTTNQTTQMLILLCEPSQSLTKNWNFFFALSLDIHQIDKYFKLKPASEYGGMTFMFHFNDKNPSF